jgi:hypothetical protein
MVVGMNVERDGDESNTSPLTGGIGAQVLVGLGLKINTSMH